MPNDMPPLPEYVAEVMSGWSLAWAGTETLARLLERHPSVRIGTKLHSAADLHAYAQQYAAQLVAAERERARGLVEALEKLLTPFCGERDPTEDARLIADARAALAAYKDQP